MKTDKNISELVDKLHKDNLSPEELSRLQRLFRAHKPEGEVNSWLTYLWKSAEQLKSNQPAARGRIVRFVRPLMRYAAVFLIAVAITWVWQGSKKLPEIQDIVAIASSGINEISVTYGSKTRIVLPDSSVVYLNSGSRLSYSSVFDSERHVTLIGEGYFIVRSDASRPFWVHTSEVSIKALGTEFNVKAYPEEGSVETFLVSGVVEILKKGQTKPIIELKPGEKAAYVMAAENEPTMADNSSNTPYEPKDTPQMIVNTIPKPDVSTGWVSNQLVFDAEPFEQIAVRLERWFNVEIEILNENLRNVRLSGRYDTENIEQVMNSLRMAAPFSYRIDKNKVIIR